MPPRGNDFSTALLQQLETGWVATARHDQLPPTDLFIRTGQGDHGGSSIAPITYGAWRMPGSIASRECARTADVPATFETLSETGNAGSSTWKGRRLHTKHYATADHLPSRAIPCFERAQQRHKIIRKRVALLRCKSVSVVIVGTVPAEQETPPMRVYIIGNDGITLCREPPAAVNEGEIVVASNEELHAAERSAASGCWRCGMRCPVSRSGKRSATAMR